ncbi:uncharacterized protein LOC144000276 [Lithobates pipiens]
MADMRRSARSLVTEGQKYDIRILLDIVLSEESNTSQEQTVKHAVRRWIRDGVSGFSLAGGHREALMMVVESLQEELDGVSGEERIVLLPDWLGEEVTITYPCSLLYITITYPCSLLYITIPYPCSLLYVTITYPCSLLYITITYPCSLLYITITYPCSLLYITITYLCSLLYITITYPCSLLYITITYPCSLLYITITYPCSFLYITITYPCSLLYIAITYPCFLLYITITYRCSLLYITITYPCSLLYITITYPCFLLYITITYPCSLLYITITYPCSLLYITITYPCSLLYIAITYPCSLLYITITYPCSLLHITITYPCSLLYITITYPCSLLYITITYPCSLLYITITYPCSLLHITITYLCSQVVESLQEELDGVSGEERIVLLPDWLGEEVTINKSLFLRTRPVLDWKPWEAEESSEVMKTVWEVSSLTSPKLLQFMAVTLPGTIKLSLSQTHPPPSWLRSLLLLRLQNPALYAGWLQTLSDNSTLSVLSHWGCSTLLVAINPSNQSQIFPLHLPHYTATAKLLLSTQQGHNGGKMAEDSVLLAPREAQLLRLTPQE